MNEAGGDFPVYVFALPCAGSNQDDGDSSVSYVVVPYSPAYFVQREILIVDVAWADGLVNRLAFQCLDESILVLLVVVVVVADENLGCRGLVQGIAPLPVYRREV